MSFLERIAECTSTDLSRYRPFRVEGTDLGLVRDDFVQVLIEFPDVFQVSKWSVDLAPGLAGPETRTEAVGTVLGILAGRGIIPGWRGEPYPVSTSFGAHAYFTMERAAVPLFGVRAYGVHLNGYVMSGGGIEMWIGRRALDKSTAPGKLDQLVAGGQPAGKTLRDNLIKECAEEASMPQTLVAQAVPVGAVTYCSERSEGLRRDVLFNYDLELPPDFRPVNADGEISEFYLWPIERVIETVRNSGEFKFNCALVVIDFLVRHGLISPDHPDYEEILRGLHG